MDKNKELDNAIKEALTLGEDNIEINMASLNEVKNRLRVREGWYSINMKKFSEFLRFGVRRRIAVTCALMLVAGISISTIEPARTFAAQNIEKVKNVVYATVKGSGSVKVADKTTSEKIEKNEYSLPKILEGGYTLSAQGSHEIYENKTKNGIGNFIVNVMRLGDPNATYEISEKGSKGLKGKVNYFSYAKGSSVITVDEEEYDNPFVTDKNGNIVKGEKEQSFKIGGQDVVYAEYTSETGANASVITSHTIKWCQNGKYYLVYDLNGDLSIDTLKLAAESIINSLNN